MTRRRRGRLDPGPILRRRRWTRRVVGLLLALLAAVVAVERSGVVTPAGGDHARFDQQVFVVSRVVDGDTVHIRSREGGETEKVRLIGVDAPEMHFDGSGTPDYWAEAAKNYLRERLEGREVTVKLEPLDVRDRYGRLLAYLYLGDSENVNLQLIRDGHAYADRRFRHTYRSQFEQAESEARRRKLGLWKDVQVEQMPGWRRRWLAEQNQ